MIDDRGDLPPICIKCTQSNGLCVRHVPHVCPQLKQPSWHRDAHEGDRDARTAQTFDPAPSPAVARARRREERKARKRSARGTRRMVRLILGEHVPVSRSA